MTIIFLKNVYFTTLCPFFMTDGRNERVNLTTLTGIAMKVVIRSYFRPVVYKLYQFPLLSIAKSKNLFIIIRNLIVLEINILAKA